MACRECHLAKVKCDKTDPCARCTKRGLVCVPHLSRQGHGRKERRQRAVDAVAGRPSKKKTKVEPLEDDVANHTLKLGAGHYGLHYAIRLWISYAVSRRSISLLGKACNLAAKVGITMDELLSGDNEFVGDLGAGYLQNVFTQPASKQVVVGNRISLQEIPIEMRNALDLCHHPLGQQRRDPENRWIIVRQRLGGLARWYVSAAFERDLATWETINETFKANSKDIKDLWLPGWEEKLKWTQGWIHQLSLHNLQGIAPCPTQTPRTKIKLGTGDVIEVECLACLQIVNLDVGFLCYEYLQPPTCEETQSSSQLTTRGGVNNANIELWNRLDKFVWTEYLEELRGLLGG